MALFAISDLHLSLSVDKPMDKFGEQWHNYMVKIKENWCNIVKEQDYVIVPGDISWATYLEQAYKDFDYINKLPGIKIISKGNHDYWWTTLNKLNKNMKKNNFDTIVFLHNNSIMYNNIAICGTKGCDCSQLENFTDQDKKIYNRELQRLELSIKHALKFNPKEIIIAMHYPPATKHTFTQSGFIDLFKKYDIKTCIYGHLHNERYDNTLIGEHKNINFYLVSSDYLEFTPIKIAD